MTIPNDFLKTHVQWIDPSDNSLIVEFPKGLEGKPKFPGDSSLADTMLSDGVPIPYSEQKNYEERAFIKSDEPKFGEVFYKFYSRQTKEYNNFKWIKV